MNWTEAVTSATVNQNSDTWVRETRIGTWFLGTGMWLNHVLPGTMRDLRLLLGPSPRIGRVLDIGCGQGFAFPHLENNFAPVSLLGIDIDPELVTRGARLASKCSCPAQIRNGDATHIELPDASVDTVFCHQTFHHLADQQRAASEFFRVLVPGGRLLFIESCRSFIFSWWVRLFFRHPMEAQKSADEYLALLRATGFEIGPHDAFLPNPTWARPDFGLLEVLGRAVRVPAQAPIVCAVARRPI